jgi:fermentation-respiration switch protein FrsA (DUF1100 family)
MGFYKILLRILIVLLIMLLLGFSFQRNLIFSPGKLSKDFIFNEPAEEVFIQTSEGERINALFYPNDKEAVILYFHGNAGDLSNWQYIAEDFTNIGYNFFIIDYRGYGKSSGTITEKGFYADAEAAYQFLVHEKGFHPDEVIIYGRSIGTGVAVELASRHIVKGLILEAPYTSLKKLANEKMPFLLPSLFLRFHFDNIRKINSVKSPVLFLHGAKDTLISPSHTNKLHNHFSGRKKKVIIQEGSHNDLNDFQEYHEALAKTISELFH